MDGMGVNARCLPQANRKAFGRASGVVVPTGLMVQTRRIVSSWMFEVPPVGGITFPFVAVVVVVVVEVLFPCCSCSSSGGG